MSSRIPRVALAATLTMSLATLPACAPRRAHVTLSYHADHVGEVPPEPLQEYIPDPPTEEHVWVPGYWYWTGTAFAWVTGRYALAPGPGHVYVRSGWVLSGGSYRFVRGYWRPPGYVVTHRYVYTRPAPIRARVYRAAPRSRR